MTKRESKRNKTLIWIASLLLAFLSITILPKIVQDGELISYEAIEPIEEFIPEITEQVKPQIIVEAAIEAEPDYIEQREIILELINEERTQIGLQPLKVNTKLNLSSQGKSDDMADKNYFAHASPTGKRHWNWVRDAGEKWQGSNVGEILATMVINTDHPDAPWDLDGLIEQWMLSPTHKKTILKEPFTDFGIGISRGKRNGVEVYFIAVHFIQSY